MKKMLSMTMLALTALATPALAQEAKNGWEGNLGLLVGTGDTSRYVTENKALAGWEAGAAYRFHLPAAGIDLRLHAEFMSVDGAQGDKKNPGAATYTKKYAGLSKNNLNWGAGFDAVYTNGRMGYFGGLALVNWNPSGQDLSQNTEGENANARVTGMKFSVRVGAEFAITSKLSARLSWTQAEYNRVVSPSWFSVGTTWRF